MSLCLFPPDIYILHFQALSGLQDTSQYLFKKNSVYKRLSIPNFLWSLLLQLLVPRFQEMLVNKQSLLPGSKVPKVAGDGKPLLGPTRASCWSCSCSSAHSGLTAMAERPEWGLTWLQQWLKGLQFRQQKLSYCTAALASLSKIIHSTILQMFVQK